MLRHNNRPPRLGLLIRSEILLKVKDSTTNMDGDFVVKHSFGRKADHSPSTVVFVVSLADCCIEIAIDTDYIVRGLV